MQRSFGLLHTSLFCTALLALTGPASRLRAADTLEPGIALAIVVDTSGSMGDPIATKKNGVLEPKHLIAQRALAQVLARLETYTRQPGAKPLAVGIYTFSRAKARVAKPLAPFDRASLQQWIDHAPRPAGPTPLGEALALAGRDLLSVKANARHILALTDGANTAGVKPEHALEQINRAAQRGESPVFAHVIAFDVSPAVFQLLERQGVTLIGAADEAQLQQKFDFILEEKILVEAP